MFKWRRRRSGLLNSQSTSQPLVAEKDRPVPYDLFGAQLRILGDGALMIIDAGANREQTTEQYLKNFPRARVLAVESIGESFAKGKTLEAALDGRLELIRAVFSDSADVIELRRAATTAAEKVDSLTIDG